MLRKRSKYFIVLLIALAVIGIFSAYTLAVDDIKDVQNELDRTQNNSPAGNNLVLEFIKIVLVLGLLILAAWSLLKFLAKSTGQRTQGTWLHVADEVLLGQNRGIVLCEVGGKLYALGVTDQNITLLFQIDNQELLKQISEEPDLFRESKAGGFKLADTLKRVFNKKSSSQTKNFHLLMDEHNQRLKEYIQENGFESEIRQKK